MEIFPNLWYLRRLEDRVENKAPDYDKITTIDEVEQEIQKYKDLICRKVKERGQIRDNKKDAMKGYNDELKEVEAQLEHGTAVIDELNRHKRLVLAGAVSPKKALQSV